MGSEVLRLAGGPVEYRWVPAGRTRTDRTRADCTPADCTPADRTRTDAPGPTAPRADRTRTDAPVVLLHEGLGSMDLWRRFPEQLAASTGRRVLVWSRHGYGFSGPALGPRPTTYMHDEALVVLPELLDLLGIEAPVLVGHSDGASIALIQAGASCRPVSGVVAIAPHVMVEALTLAGIAAARDAYRAGDLAARLARHHADGDATFWGWNDVWLSPGFRTWNIEAYLPAITAPILVVQAADDEYGTLEQVARIEAAAGGPVESLLLDSGGHAAHLAHIDRVTAAIGAWLAEGR